MWEVNLFKRLVPAFVALIVGFVFYLGVKYTINELYTGACNSGMNTASWLGIIRWFFAIMGVVVIWAFILKGWLIIQGRHPTGLEEPRVKARAKRSKVIPIQFPFGPRQE